jgi:hypothetical protein
MRLLEFDSSSEDQIPIDENVLWMNESFTKSSKPVFHGYSSTHVLSRDAAILRKEQNTDDTRSSSGPHKIQGHSEFPRIGPPMMGRYGCTLNDGTIRHLLGQLPPVDLMPVLLDAYFDNTFFPVVHRPLFVKQLGAGLHKREPSFLRLVFLVCANGARWCEDPRVLDERWPVPLSAGHRWFRQLELWPTNILSLCRLTLWDAQSIVVRSMFQYQYTL